MPTPIGAGESSLDAPRSPHSESTESSRRSSLRAYYPEKDLEPASASPRMRLTRKRAASLDVESANQPRIGDLALDSAGTNAPSSSAGAFREPVCLCQPDPKIPRPRNAFILYRQHMQSQVVAAHPGLANPEISKIIGEQWKNQTPEVKTTWKQLAEEEKQRHSRQYPNYRYQPRRAGKTNGINSVSAIAEGGPTHCPKCNGRYISTPSTPLTPFTPGFGVEGPRAERPFTPSSIVEPERSRYPPQVQPFRMSSPRMSMPPQQMQQRRMQYSHSQHMPTHHERDEEMELLSPIPDGKRRRYNDGSGYSMPSPTHYSQQQQQQQPFGRQRGPSMPVSSYRQQQQASLPGPGNIISRSIPNTSMGPPPPQSPRHPYPTRSSTNNFDESLRLPPLQTQMSITSSSSSSSRVHGMDHSTSSTNTIRESQARSIEAMVMTIPYINKIKILHRISPPLAPPGPTSPAQKTRGAVIAIEGYGRDLLAEVGRFVEETLRNDPLYSVRTWETLPKPSSTKPHTQTDVETAEPRHSLRDKSKGKGKGLSSSDEKTQSQTDKEMETDPFVEYLSIIKNMHRHSKDIVKHITTFPPSTSQQQQQKQVPIALLPSGFSLTTSDTFALKIPINDSYAPIDHWQWMATLWRGIIGPDLTVYVVRVGREEMESSGV